MIPKIIHYCWFGGNPLPDDAKKCIASWKKFFPDYEIKEWNETNYDLSVCPYVKEAYESKKWAFVSDYARFDILYKYGGLYFDTDVEVIKSFDDILKNGAFMGQEAGVNSDSGKPKASKKNKEKKANEVGVSSGVNPTSNKAGSVDPLESRESAVVVNPGLGIAVAPGLRLYKEILDYYNSIHFIKDGVMDTTTICVHTTEILKKYGYDEHKEEIQNVAGITVYPPEYFCPQNYATGALTITSNTYSIHHYTASWHSMWDNAVFRIEYCKNRKGVEFKIRRMISFPFRIISKIDKMGWKKTVEFAVGKVKKN